MESIAKFFELNGQALINSILLSEDSSERVLHKLLFFTTRKALDIFEKKIPKLLRNYKMMRSIFRAFYFLEMVHILLTGWVLKIPRECR